MASKDRVHDYWVYYDEDTRIAKRYLEGAPEEESKEIFDKAKDDRLGEKFRVEGRAYKLIYLHSNDGYRTYVLVYLGRD